MVCEGNYSLMTNTPEGAWKNFGTRVPRATLIDLAPGPDGGATDRTRTAGGADRAPRTDMFGGWTITRHAFSTRNYNDALACVDKFPDPPETRPTRINERFTAPVPNPAAVPGLANLPRHERSDSGDWAPCRSEAITRTHPQTRDRASRRDTRRLGMQRRSGERGMRIPTA